MLGRSLRFEIACLAVLLALFAASAHAQEPGRTYRLGVLVPTELQFESMRSDLLPELARHGFIEGRNLVVEIRLGSTAQAPVLAREIVAARPDVVVASGSPSIRAVAAASRTVPLVMSFMGDNPMEIGLVENMRRPGGRVTGQIMLAEELDAKRLTILLEALPRLRRVAVLTTDPPRNPLTDANLRSVAVRMGIEVELVRVASRERYREAFARMREIGADGLLIGTSAEFAGDAAMLSGLALELRLPTVCEWNLMARAGCLLGYGPNFAALRRRSADHVVRILRGANPAELPVEGPTVFEFAVNLRTARALGVELPPSILVQADEVIE
jgi:putative tryptophan/tyrosine transport system substrate-binding protein